MPSESGYSFLNMNHLCHTKVVAIQFQLFDGADYIRNMIRIKLLPEHVSVPGALWNHKGRGTENQSLNPIRIHTGHQGGNQAALRMPGKIQLIIALLPCPMDDSHRIGNPFKESVFPELTAAFTVPIQIKSQRSKAGIPHGECSSDIMRSVL